jgi:DNA invertase Pin-like site-specific DNA recombinase
MIYGYARVSCQDQHLEPQLAALQAAGCQVVYQEKASGADNSRIELQRLLARVTSGDTIVVTKLDRIARSTQHLLTVVDQMTERGVAFRVLNFGMDTGTPTGRMMLTVLGAVAEFERTLMLERQRDGITRAQALGHYKGRDPSARRQGAAVLRSLAAGLSVSQVAGMYGIGVASVYRIKRTAIEASYQPVAREPGVWSDGELPL